ncbi:MAG: sugar ABC transporter substrate-binding protein [Actinobacteria bacterium]|nr:sugar ABC transporter substrate-binding protein [Actinomycetota bacterium]
MKKIILSIIAIGTLLAILVTGCTAAQVTGGKGEVKYTGEETTAAEETAAATEAGGQWTIALMWAGTDSPYIPPLDKSMQDTIKSLGSIPKSFDGAWDATKQNTQMDDAIALKVDMILLMAVDPKGIIPAVKKAFDAGIPVMPINSPIDKEADQYIVGYTGVDTYEQGKVEAELMVEALNNEGKLAVVQGAPGFSATIDYDRALADVLKEKNSKIEVVASQTANWIVEEASTVTQDLITRFPDLNGIYPHDDYMATGVIVSLKEAGYKAGDIKITGIGGISEVLQLIKDGWVYGTVLQSPIDEGILEAQRAIEFLKSGKDKLDPFYLPLDNPRITLDNVEEFKSEF